MSRAEQLERLLARVPIIETLGMRCDIKGDDMTTVLPFRNKLIGNSAIQALHGGAIGTFLEMTAMAQLFLATDVEQPARTINITVDYLRQGRAEDLYARATIVKLGRRMASVRVQAWQAERDKPVAGLLSHFLIGRDKT
ncbi:MAG: PaaI family thioesterase [Henriciella sp.]|nr:PaaI family thioesterase [Henriciella sp.]